MTFFYASFDHATKRLTYVNAGHNPPLYLPARPSADFQSLTEGGLIVGMFENTMYEQGIVQMHAGDLLFAFTDGLAEALNSQGEEFGEPPSGKPSTRMLVFP